MRRLSVALTTAASAVLLLGAAPRPLDLAGVRRIVTYSAPALAPDARRLLAVERRLVYPVNGHFASDPLHGEDVNRRWTDWFAKKS